MKLDILFPILSWLPNYDKNNLKYDIIAGATVFLLLVPQGIAYAVLAGLPPVYGLYSSMFPLLIYPVFGSSRHLSVGPMSITSIMVLPLIYFYI